MFGATKDTIMELLSPGTIWILPPPKNRGEYCRVYWGTHGCDLPRGHEGPHICDCFDPTIPLNEDGERMDDEGVLNVGGPPYYGPDTHFYGEDS